MALSNCPPIQSQNSRMLDLNNFCQWRRQIVPNGGKKVYQSGLREKGFEAPIYLCALMAVYLFVWGSPSFVDFGFWFLS
jgi:hypothetical protein